MDTTRTPCPTEALIPHRGRMLMGQTIEEIGEKSIRSSFTPCPGGFLSTPSGKFPRTAQVELAAQLCAALAGSRGGDGGTVGFIAKIDEFSISRDLESDAKCVVACSERERFGNVAFYDCEIREGGLAASCGSLRVWSGPRPRIVPTPTEQLPRKRTQAPQLTYRLDVALLDCETSADSVVGRFVFPPEYEGFDGHFPGFPVLPGIVILESALALGGMLAGGELRLERVESAKFLKTIHPGEEARHLTRVENSGNGLILKSRVAVGQETAATLTLFAS